MKIDDIISGIIQREGGYVNHPADRGGATCWGITESVARSNGYRGEMQDMPRAFARDVYLRRYWLDPGFGTVDDLSASLAEELADTGVNMGPATAIKFLQRALNVLNQEQRLFPDIAADGQLGPATLGALGRYLKHRGRAGELVLLTAVNCLQGARYIELAENKPSQEAFVFGWLRERVGIPQ